MNLLSKKVTKWFPRALIMALLIAAILDRDTGLSNYSAFVIVFGAIIFSLGLCIVVHRKLDVGSISPPNINKLTAFILLLVFVCLSIATSIWVINQITSDPYHIIETRVGNFYNWISKAVFFTFSILFYGIAYMAYLNVQYYLQTHNKGQQNDLR